MSDSDQRQHDATPARLQAARANGDVANSRELAVASSLFVIVAIGYWLLAPVATWLQSWTVATWQSTRSVTSVAESIEQGQTTLFLLVAVLAPVLLAFLVIHIMAYWLQTGPIWSPGKAKPDMQRLGPANSWEDFSMLNWIATSCWSLPKMLVVTMVMGWGIWRNHELMMQLPGLSTSQLVPELFQLVASVAMWVAGALLLLGLVDFGFEWLAYRRRMQMTEQELRDEVDQQEGDAVNRSRQRQLDRV